MKYLLILFGLLPFLSCSSQKPTQENVEKAIRSTWDRPGNDNSPKQAVTIHSIKIGSTTKATLQDRYDGIPETSSVTIAQIDFTVREYFSDQTMATHRLMSAKVYKDQFGEWATKSTGMKIADTKTEPK